MATSKAPFKGDGSGTKIQEFSNNLREKLQKLYPDQQATSDPVWGHPADHFVDLILSEAQWAVSELHWHRLDITNQEIRAEYNALLKALKNARDKLKKLSPDFDRMLDSGADPLGCADTINELIVHVEKASPQIDELPKAMRPAEKEHYVAVEMTIRILRLLKEFKIPPSATFDENFGYKSVAIEILEAIGDDIGLDRSPVTWRDIVIAAKEEARDIQ